MACLTKNGKIATSNNNGLNPAAPLRFCPWMRNNNPMVTGRHTLFRSSLLAAALIASPAAFAQDGAWSEALQPELELTSHLSERLDIRFGVNRQDPVAMRPQREGFALDDGSLQFSTLIDYSLHESGLRMTGGAVVGEDWLSTDSIGTPRLDNPDMQTYLGVGWDNDFGTQGRFGLSLDMGLAFEGLNDTSMSDDPAVSEAAPSDDASLGTAFESFRYTPSFSAGIEYRF